MNFFDYIQQTFEIIMGWLSNLMNSFLLMFDYIGAILHVTPVLAAVMPQVIGGCVLVVTALGILKFVVGR